MYKRLIAGLFCALVAFAQNSPRAIADRFSSSKLKLTAEDWAGAYVAKEYTTAHNGITHILYRQRFYGLEVADAAWSVNIDREGRVLNSGGRLFAKPEGVTGPDLLFAPGAARAAVKAVNPKASFSATYKKASERAATFERGSLAEDVQQEGVWIAVNGILRPAWRVTVVDEDGVRAYSVVVEDRSGKILRKDDLTFFQRALVYEKGSPQPNPTPGVQNLDPRPIVDRTWQPLTGDPVASPKGWVTGEATSGNNIIAGQNLNGTSFLTTPILTSAPGGVFDFPIQLGAGAPNPINFRDAATTNLFYWANRAHDLFYSVGFDEAAGNYQVDNLGKGGIAGDPIYIYSHYGAAANSAAQLNNAFYTTRGTFDGAQSMVAMFLSPVPEQGIYADGSLDAQVIVHEYAHGVSNRLVNNFRTLQGSAMGEAWSDFFSLEFTTPEGAPADGVYPVGEYFVQGPGLGIRTRPYSTNKDVNPLSYADLGHLHSRGPEVHDDGEIWMEALWEVRGALIQQFGEREGRRRVRLLVMDGMKLSTPSPTMVDARDAILLADRVDFQGASQQQIWDAFARRGLGALAASYDANQPHIAASYETSSPTGKMRFYETEYSNGQSVNIIVQDANVKTNSIKVQLTGSSGDIETLELDRDGEVFTGTMPTRTGAVNKNSNVLDLIPGDSISAYYTDADTGGGQWKLIEHNVPAKPGYVAVISANNYVFGQETALGLQGDDVDAIVTLPFAFPFFGTRTTRAWINSNGILALDYPAGSLCPSPSGLATLRGFAPLYMDLRTDGAAQAREDVYRSLGPDSVTYRWVAETFPTSTLTRPEPVNFAITLFQDGRVEYKYGSGNRNLVSTGVYAGCSAGTATVGYGNGSGTYGASISTHTASGTLENAPNIMLFPPFGFNSIPEGRLDTPVDGQTVRGILSGTGILYDRQTLLSRLDILVDNVAVGTARLSVPRPDVCVTPQTLPGCPNVGFTFNLNLQALGIASGQHTLRFRGTNIRGAFFDFPENPVTFNVEEGQSREAIGRIEVPTAGSEISGRVTVAGYAYIPDLTVSAVDILIDGVTFGPASYTSPRADICAGSVTSPNCPRVGFTFALNTLGSPLLPNGEHQLQARVRDETGRFTLLPPIPIVVNNPVIDTKAPVGVLESPKNGETISGTVTISGYAYDPDGRVASIRLLVDNGILYTVPYGNDRSATCEALPDVPACPNIGFSLNFNTRALTNGLHSFQIFVTDNQGTITYVPHTSAVGINVFVQN